MRQPEMLAAITAALRRKVETLTFQSNSYNDEAFFAKSIADDFTGWYDEKHVKQQISFVLKHCDLGSKAKVLDAACGHGRHAELLAEMGHTVTGIDISEKLISHLTQKHGDRINFERQPFAKISYHEAFDLIMVLGNSLGLIPREELLIVLPRLRESLKKGGLLFIELDNRSHFIKNEAGRKAWNCYAERWLLLSEHYYDQRDRLEKTIDMGIDLKDGSVDQFHCTKSLYDIEELSEMMMNAQLIVDQTFGNWDGSPISEDSPSILIKSRRAF